MHCNGHVVLLGAAALALVAGCQPSGSSGNRSGQSIMSARRSELPELIRAGKVEFRRGEGEELYSFKPREDGSCKFYDASGDELCKLSLSNDQLKVKSVDDQPLFELKAKDDKLMIKDASGELELFKLKFKGDTIDFYAPGDRRLYRIKRQPYGWRLEDNAGQTLFRGKSQGDRMVLRGIDDLTILYSNDLTSPLGLVFFQIPELTLQQQAAVCLFLLDR